MPEFPNHRLPVLHEAATRLLDSRKDGTPSEPFARELLVRFADLCTWMGLDGVLAQLPPGFDDDPAILAALAARLDAADLDGGGPRNARAPKVAECVLGALGVTLADEPDRTIAIDDAVRAEIAAAIKGPLDAALAPPTLREAVIAHARQRCDEAHILVFDKIVAQLDDRGLRMMKQPKVPLDASQVVQRLLSEARIAVLGNAAGAALDRAKEILARADAAAAARIDEPITRALTPREVLIWRLCDERSSKVPASVATALVDGIAELARLTWRAPETAARPYGISQTYAVGDVIEHPKFGRGSVVSVAGQRIEVEFADGKKPLVHARK
jgi:hypothetical protein